MSQGQSGVLVPHHEPVRSGGLVEQGGSVGHCGRVQSGRCEVQEALLPSKTSHRLVPHQMTDSRPATLGARDGGEQRVDLGVAHDVVNHVEAAVSPGHQTSVICLQR